MLDELELLCVAHLEHRCGRTAHEDNDVLQVHQSVQVVVVEVGVAGAVADETASVAATGSGSSS